VRKTLEKTTTTSLMNAVSNFQSYVPNLSR